MKKLILITTVAAFMMLLASGLFAQGYEVIANKDVPGDSVSADSLKKIFLGQKTSWDGGGKAAPVIQEKGPAHEGFLKAVVAKTTAQFSTFWKNAIFTGQGVPPKTVASDADVMKFVAATKGAVGYVSAGLKPDAGVKVLSVK